MSSSPLVILAEILLINFSVFGIAAFLFMHASLSFLESSAILTDLSFLIVITAGDIKQFSVVLSTFSRLKDYFSSSPWTIFWEWIGTGRLFCCMGLTSSFSWISIVRSLMVWFFWIDLHTRWWFSLVFRLLPRGVAYDICFLPALQSDFQFVKPV